MSDLHLQEVQEGLVTASVRWHIWTSLPIGSEAERERESTRAKITVSKVCVPRAWMRPSVVVGREADVVLETMSLTLYTCLSLAALSMMSNRQNERAVAQGYELALGCRIGRYTLPLLFSYLPNLHFSLDKTV